MTSVEPSSISTFVIFLKFKLTPFIALSIILFSVRFCFTSDHQRSKYKSVILRAFDFANITLGIVIALTFKKLQNFEVQGIGLSVWVLEILWKRSTNTLTVTIYEVSVTINTGLRLAKYGLANCLPIKHRQNTQLSRPLSLPLSP